MVQSLIDAAVPDVTPHEQELIERAEALGHGVVAENATAVDRGTLSVRANLEALASAGLAGLNVPRRFDGSEVSRPAEMRVLEALCYGDGTTPFVIAQHYGTSSMLAHSANEALRDEELPRMADGASLAGFGISHLRRAGKPMLAVTPVDAGYRLDGAIPWMTGYGLFDHVVIAGTLPDGQALTAWAPFYESEQMHFSPPMELVAMNGAMTVSATIEGLIVRREQVVAIGPSAMRERPSMPPVPCLFGLIRAGIDDLAALAERRNAPASAQAAERLAARLGKQRPIFYELAGRTESAESLTTLARVRAAVTQLALDTAGALIVATGGGANGLASAAQRRLRETSVFATWGLAPEAINVAVAALSEQ